MRFIVVGASTGLGRCIAVGMVKAGHQVALLARRKDKLDDAVAEGGGGHAICCDVTDMSSCTEAVEEAVRVLGGVDGLLYAPALGPLARIHETSSDIWHRAFDVNVVGTNNMTTAVLPHLVESEGTAAYLSSISASQFDPWPGLGAYIVTKAAMDKLVDVWRAEHPRTNFTRIVVGNCIGGEGDNQTHFTDGWDPTLAAEVGMGWFTKGLVTDSFVHVDEVVRVVESVLTAGKNTSIPTVTVCARQPA